MTTTIDTPASGAASALACALVAAAAAGLDSAVRPEELLAATAEERNGAEVLAELDSLIRAARAQVEMEPDYSAVAARLLIAKLTAESLCLAGTEPRYPLTGAEYGAALRASVAAGLAAGLLDARLGAFDLEPLAAALRPERDALWQYAGAQTIYDRYLLRIDDQINELPQIFWMRVAMGLALGEEREREAWAVRFYDVLSQQLVISATPTLFNAGTAHPQLSSCYLTTVQDDLDGIFSSIKDNALLSKWAGGLGNDWTNVRALGARINGTGGRSQGVIPFLKIVNDTAIAVNQGGKRKGAVCAYLEVWHLDIEDFLDLRKNTGDERRRAHDMHTAAWIPDLFMERVRQDGSWTLFSPDDVPDLHDLYGRAFAARYAHYEAEAAAGRLRGKAMRAVELWRKLLTRLFETGHPWLTWKDPANIRSPQDHAGVIHSSNLCTEILLNTSAEETAVCNLASVNLGAHCTSAGLDTARLAASVATAVRMLDNVIDINFYPTPEARRANERHRPIGLGMMGFQDALHKLGISYASDAAVTFADETMERIAHAAISASCALAAERGAYASYRGSKWERGLLPQDTIALLAAERGDELMMDTSSMLDWAPVRAAIAQHGMRNSNVMAIAPTATIATIAGASPSIEPTYRHLHAKSNLSGDFVAINRALVAELKALGLWDGAMVADLKYYDGSIMAIERIPVSVRERFPTAFEIAPEWLIACASRRQKWIDMGQSLNLYLATPSGRRLEEIYMLAWRMGLKTTYYLRTLGATQVEKSTLDINRYGVQPRWMQSASASGAITVARDAACADDEICEVCQ